VCGVGFSCQGENQWYSQCRPCQGPCAVAPIAAPVAAPIAAPVAAPIATPVAAPVAAPVPVASPVASPIAAPINATPAQTVYGQCGGKGWTGPIVCEQGGVCVANGEWYSQCRPGTADANPDAPPPSPALPTSFAPFTAADTRWATRHTVDETVLICGRTELTFTQCVQGGSCSGDTYLRLYDASGSRPLESNNDGQPKNECGTCAKLTYDFTGACQEYTIRQGCANDNSCAGTTVIIDSKYSSSLESFSSSEQSSSSPDFIGIAIVGGLLAIAVIGCVLAKVCRRQSKSSSILGLAPRETDTDFVIVVDRSASEMENSGGGMGDRSVSVDFVDGIDRSSSIDIISNSTRELDCLEGEEFKCTTELVVMIDIFSPEMDTDIKFKS
jgi:hypothetical protein